ncbi:MAG: hypothetical protein K5696_00760 [Lachnospiraceae bacterium]|nr:hypothetical protein [Lachnospiraceae bacterium]
MKSTIICKTCGAEYDVSRVRCPYCGTAYAPAEEEEYMDRLEEIREDLHRQVEKDNTQPERKRSSAIPSEVHHAQNMRRFGRKYAATEKEVNRFARSVEGLGWKAAILIVLLLGIIITTVVSSMNYADPDEDEAARRDAENHAAAYAEDADGFLERGEYTEYVSFLYAHELMNFPPEEFQRFQRVQNVAREYYECIKLMEEMILRSDDPEYFDGLDTDIRNFCMYLTGFCETLEAQKSAEKDEKYLANILDMDTELHAAMRACFSMDEEGVRELLDMSQTQKAVRIREVLRHE